MEARLPLLSVIHVVIVGPPDSRRTMAGCLTFVKQFDMPF
jgi:hypothetical protein